MKPLSLLIGIYFALLCYHSSASAQDRQRPDRDGLQMITKNQDGKRTNHFQYANDSISYVVKSGPNASACVEAIVHTRDQSNLGWCENAANFVSMQGNPEWRYNNSAKRWVLEQTLLNHPYMVIGTYRFFWKDNASGETIGPVELTIY